MRWLGHLAWDTYERDQTPDSRPTFGLDDGETDGIVLANALAVDGFLTDEFGGTNFPLIHAVLQGSASSQRRIANIERTHLEGPFQLCEHCKMRVDLGAPSIVVLVIPSGSGDRNIR